MRLIRSRRTRLALWALAAGLAFLSLFALPAAAYTPGSGTLYSDPFAGTTPDEGWEMGSGNPGNPAPWVHVPDGGDFSFYADGIGGTGVHWARRMVHPVPATSFSVAFEYRGDLGQGYAFDLEVEQRAPTLRKYRMRVGGDGAVSFWRSEGGTMTLVATSGPRLVQKRKTRWLRFAIEPDGGGHPWLRARVWNNGAANEPAVWDLEFLDANDTIERVHRLELFADSSAGVETFLDDLDVFGDTSAGVVSPIQVIYLAELSHLDIGFTEPPDDIEAFAKTHLDQVLNNLDADPDYRWVIESGWWLDRWWERSSASQRQRMTDHLVEGRLALAAGYGNLHTTTAGHEELTRNIYWTSKLARTHGFPLRFLITNDVPGSTFAMPELLSRAGIDYFVGGMNTSFGGTVNAPDHGDRPFWWEGPDGSRVLAWTTFNSYAEAFRWGFSFFDTFDDLFQKMGEQIPILEESGYPYPETLLFRGFDNHYQGFKARNLIDQWNATYSNPQFVLANPDEFLDFMLAKYGASSFPVYTGDYGCAWAPSRGGTPHSSAWVRQSHREGRAAEALIAAGAAVDGDPVPQDDLDFMYRKMLEWDEHTGAGGWPEYFTPEEMQRNNTIHLGYARDARDTARSLFLEGVTRSISELSAAGDTVVAINPLGRARDGWVRQQLPPALYGSAFRVIERESGLEVPYQRFDAESGILFRAETIPPVGYRVFDLVPGEPTAVPGGMLQATSTTLENDDYRLELDPTDGSVISLVRKATAWEMVDGASAYGFNVLASNTKQQYDFQGAPVAEPPASATLTLDVDGPLMAAIRVTRTGSPQVETIYRLYRGEDRVELENVLDRDEMPYVPLATSARAYMVTLPFDIHDFEIRSETTTRFLDPVGDSFDRANLFDWHNVEHTLALHDATGGVLYAVDGVYAHHLENLSSLTSGSYSTGDALILSRMYDRSDEYTYKGGTVGAFEREPGEGPIVRYVHHVRGTDGSFDPVEASRFGFEALSPLPSRLLGRRTGNLPTDAASFFTVEEPEVLLYTVKPAEVGEGVVLRMTELTGAATIARVRSDVLQLTSPERVEQDEDGGVPLSPDGNGFLVPLGPYETATVRVQTAVDWAPVSLAVEKAPGPGTVRLSWSGGRTPFTLRRADDAVFQAGVVTLVDEEDLTSHDDPVLGDGLTYFYLAD